MSSPFDILHTPGEEEILPYDEWGGQFSCQQAGCNGWASVAKFFRKEHVLVWKCAEGHMSQLEDVND